MKEHDKGGNVARMGAMRK